MVVIILRNRNDNWKKGNELGSYEESIEYRVEC